MNLRSIILGMVAISMVWAGSSEGPSKLSGVHKLFIEKLPNNLDQYIRTEIFKQMPGQISIVVDKADADAVLGGSDEQNRRIATTLTGNYLGFRETTTAAVSVYSKDGKEIVWAYNAGDRNLFLGVARSGQAKVAERIVSQLKKAMSR